MQRFIHLIAVLFFLVMSTTVNAQVTGTRLINKATLTSGNYSGTLTYLYTDRTGTDIGVRKVTAPDILDFAGLGPTDVVTHGGAILNGNLTVTGTSVLAGTLTLSGGLVSNTASITTLTNSGTITTGTLQASSTLSSALFRVGTTIALGSVGVGNWAYASDATYCGLRQDGNARTTIIGANSASGGVFITYDGGLITGTNAIMGALQGVVVFNEGSADRDFRIEGDTNANLFALDAGTDTIGIGTATPNGTFHLSGSFASSIRATAASGNITATDNVVTGTGAITLTLPTAVSITGREYILKNIGGVTMTAGSAGGTIDAATTQAIISGAGSASSMKFKSDGTNWLIID